MRFVYYTNKFLELLADNLRRLAEFLHAGTSIKNDAGDENDASPLANWHEKTRNIPPEQWIDFSAETVEGPAGVLTQSAQAARESAEKIEDLKKDKVHRKTEESSEGIFKRPSTAKQKPDSGYLSFKQSGRTENQNAESTSQSLTKSRSEPSTDNETPFAVPKRNFKLHPSSPILGKKQKSVFSDSAEISERKVFEPDEIVPILEQRKSAKAEHSSVSPQAKKEKHSSVSSQTTKKEKVKETQVTNPSPHEGPQLAKDHRRQPMVETVFKVPKQNKPVDFVFGAKAKNATEKSVYLPAPKEKASTASEDVIVKHNRQNYDTVDSYVFATPPWIDLPDEFLPEAIDEIMTRSSAAEHLLYLELEQGREINKNK